LLVNGVFYILVSASHPLQLHTHSVSSRCKVNATATWYGVGTEQIRVLPRPPARTTTHKKNLAFKKNCTTFANFDVYYICTPKIRPK